MLNMLNTSKIEVDDKVSISINIKGQKFNDVTKEIFFNYFKEGKRDLLFGNYVIGKENNSRINMSEELPLLTSVGKDNSLMSFLELNNLDNTFTLEKSSDLLDIAAFYKKKCTLLKTKYLLK
ncbi:hypothetical protein ABK040_016649 [Willaertia magna]